MENRQSNLRIPRRAITQWERVKVKLTTRILARGQEADGPTIFCEACGLLDAVLGGSGIIAEEGAPVYEADDRLNLARALAARPMTGSTWRRSSASSLTGSKPRRKIESRKKRNPPRSSLSEGFKR